MGSAPNLPLHAKCMAKQRQLDLAAIEKLLREVQAHYGELSTHFFEPREPFVDAIWQNMLAGYALVESYVQQGVDLFSLRDVGYMLEINATVLCGTDAARRKEFLEHIVATEQRFFDGEVGGAKDLLEWYDMHRSESPWKRAAGVYVRVLSKPQLFIEGNHRSGALLVSYLLMREGLPPFVLTVDNAEAFFNPSSVIRNVSKQSAMALFKMPKIKKKYAAFLEEQSAFMHVAWIEKGATRPITVQDTLEQSAKNPPPNSVGN